MYSEAKTKYKTKQQSPEDGCIREFSGTFGDGSISKVLADLSSVPKTLMKKLSVVLGDGSVLKSSQCVSLET